MVMRVSLNPENQKSFSFTVSCKELEVALSRLSAVVSTTSVGVKNFFVVTSRGKVAVLAFNTDTYAYIELAEATSTSDGAFGFDPSHIQGLVKGRSSMEFTFTGSECEFKLVKGKYNGRFVVLPVSQDQATTVNSALSAKDRGEDKVITRDVLDALKEGLALTGIKDVYSDGSLLSYIDITKGGQLTISCFDQHHLGFYQVKTGLKGEPIRIALPGSHFQLIDRLAGEEDAKFFIKSESIRVEGSNFVLILPASQSDDKNFSIVTDYLASLDKPELLCVVHTGKLATLVDNLFTIYSANTSFDLAFREGASSLAVTFTTNNGSGSDSLPVKVTSGKSIKAKVEPRLFKDALSILHSQGEVQLSIKTKKWIKFDLTTNSGARSTVVCSLAG